MNTGNSSRRYRADIDGMRAIAVLMVLGNHLDTWRMGGGYIGVDIFFVISGYLITGIVARDIALDRFSLAGFYERRIRRIIPALIVVLAASTLAVYFVFPPTQLLAYCYSLLAALFSYANLYFATQSGYFEAGYTQILQHTWSLGVEEQFYLVLPVCLLLCMRRSRRLAQWFIGVGWVISFTWSCFMVFRDMNTAYYSPTTRAWELLSGSALAMGMVPDIKSRWMREGLAAASLLVIGICMVRFSSATLFPGPTALPVCLGAVLLLKIGEDGPTFVTQPLQWRPVVFIGLISYSLYLWHWPVLVFLHLGLLPGWTVHTPAQRAIVTAGSIALAALTYRFVEQPFRTGRWSRAPRRNIFALAGGVSVSFLALVFLCTTSHGLAWRFSPEAANLGRYLDKPQEMRTGVCFYINRRQPIRRSDCLNSVDGKKNLLLLGDSHAAMYWYALTKEEPKLNVMQLNASGCLPIPGGYDRSNCGRVRKYLFEQYLPSATPDAVIITARWHQASESAELTPLLELFASRHIPVYIIGPVPEYEAALPLLLTLGLKWNDPALAQSHRIRRLDALDEELNERFSHDPGVTYISAYAALCHADACQEYVDDAHTVPVMFDDNHLSNAASLQLVHKWLAAGELPL